MRVVGLDVHCMRQVGCQENRVIQWSLPSLEASLGKKHQSTFWVKADVRHDADGVEYFHYQSLLHTKAAITPNLGPLIDRGKVTVDLTLSQRVSGRVRDHGYLFRMASIHHDLLFPAPIGYEL